MILKNYNPFILREIEGRREMKMRGGETTSSCRYRGIIFAIWIMLKVVFLVLPWGNKRKGGKGRNRTAEEIEKERNKGVERGKGKGGKKRRRLKER